VKKWIGKVCIAPINIVDTVVCRSLKAVSCGMALIVVKNKAYVEPVIGVYPCDTEQLISV
jgi:hypothetical protein